MGAWNQRSVIANLNQSAMGAGRVPGRTSVYVFGENTLVGASYEAVWSAGGPYTFPTAALPLRVTAGGNVNDDAAGTGAREVTVIGLDGNGDPISETIANGVAFQPLTDVWVEAQRATGSDSAVACHFDGVLVRN